MSASITIQRVFLVLAALALALSAGAQAPGTPGVFAGTTWNLSGYVQGRFAAPIGSSATLPYSAFDDPRSYLVVRAAVNERVRGALVIYGKNRIRNGATILGTDLTMLEAYGEYGTQPWRARLGLSSIPFGYEAPVSSAALITLERSQVTMEYTYPYGFERGLFNYYTPAGKVGAMVALVNGGNTNNISGDTNPHKTLAGRVFVPLTGNMPGEFGISGYNGLTAAGTEMTRVGVDLRLTSGEVTLLTEAISAFGPSTDTARTGSNAAGGYLTLAYRKAGAQTQPYARYDVLDSDVTADAATDNFHRMTYGINQYLNANTKATLEYEVINNEADPNLNGRVTAQYQVTF